MAALDFLHHSESALFLLDASRKIVWHNARAGRYLRNDPILFEDPEGRLVLRSESHQSRLIELFPSRIDRLPTLGVIANQEEAVEASWMLVLWPRDIRIDGQIARFVLAQFRRGDEQRAPDIATLQRAFGFTAKEAGVVQALALGRDLAEHANATESTLATVRWHLKNALEKAHCRNQKQLLLLVGSLKVTIA